MRDVHVTDRPLPGERVDGLRGSAFAGELEPVTVSVEVENTGATAGEEVVQLYLKEPRPSLAGFQRISLRSKEKRTVQFTLEPRQLAGAESFNISIGGKQPGFRGVLDASTTGVVTGNLRITR